MNRSILNLFTLMVLFIAMAAQAESTPIQEVRFIGYAKSPSNGELLYQEKHSIVYSSHGQRLSSEVQYFSPDGKLFAEKSLSYGAEPTVPTMAFFDHRIAQSILVKKQSDSVLVENVVNGDTEKTDVSDSDDLPMVADAGFDMFMVSHWQSLMAGKKHTMDFLAITRGQFIEFEIVKTHEAEKTVSFELKPSSFLISMLVDPIVLTYDKSTANILYYKGLTNIEKAELTADGWYATGDNHVAVIEYEYETTLSYLNPSHKD